MSDENIIELLRRSENKLLLAQALEKLSQKRRDLLVQVYYEEKPVSQIARELGISRRAVYYRLDTIKKKLRVIFKNEV